MSREAHVRFWEGLGVRFPRPTRPTHQVLDVAFQEDARPWIVADANGMLSVLILRRVAYTLMALFRSVTQRSEENRVRPWRELFRWVHVTLVAASFCVTAGLRPRSLAVVCG